MLAADLDKVKAKINADPERYTFGNRPNESKEASKPTNEDVFIMLHNASHPVLVREHLDSVVLERMIVELRVQKRGNALCLLAACAMQLGFTCPLSEVRFGKALRDYRNGVPCSYITKGLQQIFSSGCPTYQESEVFWMRLEDVPTSEEITQHNTSLERIRCDFNQPVDVCGNCGAGQCGDGSKLKRCVGCKKRLYCFKTCQKAHTPKHSCTKDGTAPKRGGRCKGRNYCSVGCQKEHYPMHAPKCKATVAEAKSKQEGGGRVKGLNVAETWR
ncbi:hypothetical protein E4T43_02506 [Aureobasidium subglaciale]|nr:hypothetical protein E4T43_02506 [Aureobasidium subglaciale]